jgi:carbon-monoxide dehydrogenase large subunit
LLEFVAHDQVSGQPLNASFMDYAMPRADDLPSLNLWFNPSRCTTNPLGVKGCGEAGAIAAPVAIQNAIIDALTPFGVKDFDGPATPERVWRAMRGMT